MSSLPHDATGQVIDGRYRILARVGGGGMGTVYSAQQLNIDRTVAVKVMRAMGAEDLDLASRFEEEAKIISSLRHPNTIKLFDYGRMPDGVIYFVTELLSGRPLSEVIREGPLEPLRALRIVRDVCLSLDEAHARGIVHRDLKPANIFLERIGGQEVVKVLDFGIAKIDERGTLAGRLRASHLETAPDVVIGTPAYMSPEQALSQPVGARSDLYSLGVVAYECLTGQLPFSGSPRVLMTKHLRDRVPAFGEVAAGLGIDPRVEALVMKMLEKDLEERPASAAGVAQEIERLTGQLTPGLFVGTPPAHATPLGTSIAASSPGRPWLPAIFVAGALGLGAVIAFLASRSPPAPAPVPVAAPAIAVRDVAIIAGWRDERAVREAIASASGALAECHGAAFAGASGETLRLRLTIQGTESAVSVAPSTAASEAFRMCADKKLTTISWPPPSAGPIGIAGLEIGPR